MLHQRLRIDKLTKQKVHFSTGDIRNVLALVSNFQICTPFERPVETWPDLVDVYNLTVFLCLHIRGYRTGNLQKGTREVTFMRYSKVMLTVCSYQPKGSSGMERFQLQKLRFLRLFRQNCDSWQRCRTAENKIEYGLHTDHCKPISLGGALDGALVTQGLVKVVHSRHMFVEAVTGTKYFTNKILEKLNGRPRWNSSLDGIKMRLSNLNKCFWTFWI